MLVRTYAKCKGNEKRQQPTPLSVLFFYELLTSPARPRHQSLRLTDMTTQNSAPLRRGLVGLLLVASVALALTTATSNGARSQTAVHKLMEGSDIPVPIRAILQRACQDCHSENTVWPWYGHIPPISWQIQSDVEKGRAFMNLSRWNEYTKGERQGLMVTIEAAIENQLMPPQKYMWMHSAARLSNSERELVKAWALAKDRNLK